MPKVVVRNFACSLDGFGAGLHQSQSEPFGNNAIQIMNWFNTLIEVRTAVQDASQGDLFMPWNNNLSEP